MTATAAYEMLTAIRNGEAGGTYANNDTTAPTEGYWIGGAYPSLINPTEAQIVEFVESTNSTYFGFWYDNTVNGTLYVDAVTHTTSERWAARLTALRNEIAYYNATTNQEVRV